MVHLTSEKPVDCADGGRALSKCSSQRRHDVAAVTQPAHPISRVNPGYTVVRSALLHWFWPLTAALLVPGCAFASGDGGLALAAMFQDHAVLQCDHPVAIWGTDHPGNTIAVSFHGTDTRTVANAQGRWRVDLAPMPATSTPADLVVSDGRTLVLHDVVVGEVWLCAGQSNMEFVLRHAAGATEAIAAAQLPLIREIKITPVSTEPAAPQIAGGRWTVCSPASAGTFSAVGFFLARELHQALGKPIGIINCTLGGSCIETWISERTLLGDRAYQAVFDRWSQRLAGYPERYATCARQTAEWDAAAARAKAAGKPFSQVRPLDFWEREVRVRPMGLYNGMAAPMTSYVARGVAWYQGEQNAGQSDYQQLLMGLIGDWREQRGDPTLPFIVVQLPEYGADNPSGTAWARTREAQANVARIASNVGLAVTIDLGDPANVHPTRKQEVGHRVALQALARVYGRRVASEGPVFQTAQFESDRVIVGFLHADGLHTNGPTIPGFEVAGADRRFTPADAAIAGSTLVVSSPRVPHPVALRYAWHNATETDLFNGAGLPAAPFRTDFW